MRSRSQSAVTSANRLWSARRAVQGWASNATQTVLDRMYADRTAALALEIDDPGAGWWEAPRRDLLDSAADFAWLAAQLRADNDIRVRRAGHLTELRLLDIIAWTLGSLT